MKQAIVEQWFDEALSLSAGQALHLPVHDKAEQKSTAKAFNKLLQKYAYVNAEKASMLSITTTFKDSTHWVKITRLAQSPLVGFKTNVDGTQERVLLKNETVRRRQLMLMIKDGCSLEEIEDAMGGLSDDERKEVS